MKYSNSRERNSYSSGEDISEEYERVEKRPFKPARRVDRIEPQQPLRMPGDRKHSNYLTPSREERDNRPPQSLDRERRPPPLQKRAGRMRYSSDSYSDGPTESDESDESDERGGARYRDADKHRYASNSAGKRAQPRPQSATASPMRKGEQRERERERERERQRERERAMGAEFGFSIFNCANVVSCLPRHELVDCGRSGLRYDSDDETQKYNQLVAAKPAVTHWTPEKEKLRLIKQGK